MQFATAVTTRALLASLSTQMSAELRIGRPIMRGNVGSFALDFFFFFSKAFQAPFADAIALNNRIITRKPFARL